MFVLLSLGNIFGVIAAHGAQADGEADTSVERIMCQQELFHGFNE